MRLGEEDLSIQGIRIATAASGLRYAGRDDLAVLEIAPGSRTHCVFTQNRFRAAPVDVAQEHLALAAPRFLVINAGNANAGTGSEGIQAARDVCRAVADVFSADANQVLPFSTGVIGEQLDAQRIANTLPTMPPILSGTGWSRAAEAIMTTDTRSKLVSCEFELGGKNHRIVGIAKGSGMIRPNMATMLAYVGTDVAIAPDLLAIMTQQAADTSFNRITVDGDTSTNDALAVISTGSRDMVDSVEHRDYATVQTAINAVCTQLAQKIIEDGEGATKFVSIRVSGGQNEAACLNVAYTVAESPLVKTAMFAADPNWGRILAAVGRAPDVELNIAEVDITIGDEVLIRSGEPAPNYDESNAAKIMAGDRYEIHVRIGQSAAEVTVWTCDFSYDYVKINADYRS